MQTQSYNFEFATLKAPCGSNPKVAALKERESTIVKSFNCPADNNLK